MQQLDKNTRDEKGIRKGFNFLFSGNEKKLILIIFVIGLILRVIVASNITPVEDEMIHGVHAIGFSKLAPLSALTQAPVWQYLTDYAYRIFGISLLTARILSVIFGSLSIIVVYFLGSLLFNRRAGLIAAFLLAVSAFHITWTASYQDQTMMFFVLLASYFFIKEYQSTKKISLVSAICLAIAELIKIITGIFVIIFIVFSIIIIYQNYTSSRKLFKTNIKRFIIAIAILLVALTPIIAYNIFLFKAKGIVDQPLAQFLRINPEFYIGPGLHHEEGFVLNKLGKNLYSIITVYFLKEDAIIFLLGLMGIIWFTKQGFKNNQKFETAYFLVLFFFTLLFLASSIVLQTHYTSFIPLFALFSAPFVIFLFSKINKSSNKKIFLFILLIGIALYNFGNLHDVLTSQSATQKVRNYASESIDVNTLVLVDSRIYTGTYVWMLNDKHYFNALYLPELLKGDKTIQFAPVKTIFIECINDDCGWGTIKNQPELNNSMEQIISQLKNISKIKNFIGGGSIKNVRGAEIRGTPFYRIYETSIAVNPSALQIIDKTHNHFFYHIPRDIDITNAYDYYTINGAFDKTLNVFAYIILIISIGLAIGSIFLPFYLLKNNN